MASYTGDVSAVADAASKAARDAYMAMRLENLNASVAEIRNASIDIASEGTYSYGGAASEAAAEVYDALSEAAGSGFDPAELDEGGEDVDAAIVDRVRYLMRSLVNEREDI